MKKTFDLPSAYWDALRNEFGGYENGLQKILEERYPKAKNAPRKYNKTEKILLLISKGIRTSASLNEHMPDTSRGVITTTIHELQQRNYVEIDTNEWPRVYTITAKGLEKIQR